MPLPRPGGSALVIVEQPDRVFPQASPPAQHKLEQGKAGDGVWGWLGNAIIASGEWRRGI